jgi:DNA-binding NarL/FixJ family response regulator
MARASGGIGPRGRVRFGNMPDELAPVRIVIADDHPVVRRGLRQTIEEDPEFTVVAEAADGEAAIRHIQNLQPDIAVLDLDMPKLDGLAVLQQLNALGLTVATMFLTVHQGEDLFHQVMDLGARAYLLKEAALVEIATALRTVRAQHYYVTPSMTVHLLRRRAREQCLQRELPGLAGLTPVEQRILRLIGTHKSSKEIAAVLGLHFRTIENRRTAICDKLNLHGANALLRFALEHRAELGN